VTDVNTLIFSLSDRESLPSHDTDRINTITKRAPTTTLRTATT